MVVGSSVVNSLKSTASGRWRGDGAAHSYLAAQPRLTRPRTPIWPAVGSIVGAMQNVETMSEPIQTQDIQRPPQSLIDSLKEIGSATASGELKRLGIRNA